VVLLLLSVSVHTEMQQRPVLPDALSASRLSVYNKTQAGVEPLPFHTHLRI
jgi:hypothetical protein